MEGRKPTIVGQRHRLPVIEAPRQPFFRLALGTLLSMGWLQGMMFSYGLFNILMGFLGYVNKHSVASLAAGGAAGILVIGFAALSKTNPRVGFIGATVVGLLVGGRFALHTFQGEVYPAGIIFVVSLIFAVTLVGAHFAAVNRRKKEEIAKPVA